MLGSRMAASIAMTAMTPTISRSVNPARPLTPSLVACGRNIGGGAGSALLSVGAVGEDLIGAAFSRRSIEVGLAPGIARHAAAFEIGTVPCRQPAGGLYQRGQSFRGGRVASGVEVEQV